mmetsp:Transcript_7965/g.17120  ORF Transcript_7965/g.17120 Transcript_7965/m.17120 type:complete len:244 (-) Transcript_7965:3159-3890(-)
MYLLRETKYYFEKMETSGSQHQTTDKGGNPLGVKPIDNDQTHSASKENYFWKKDGSLLANLIMNCSGHRRQSTPPRSAFQNMPLFESSHGTDEPKETRKGYFRELWTIPNGNKHRRSLLSGKSGANDCSQTRADEFLNEACSASAMDGISKETDDDYDNYDDFYDDERDGCEVHAEVAVPLKYDNYVNKRSYLSKEDSRRRELLLDDSSAIIDAMQAHYDGTDKPLVSSDDEESYAEDDEVSL